MTNDLNPNAPFSVILFAHGRFSRELGSTKVQVTIYSTEGHELVVFRTSGHIQFAANGLWSPMGENETAQFAKLRPLFGKVVVKLSDSPEEPTFPTYEAFITKIS